MDSGRVLVNFDHSDNLQLQCNGLNLIEKIPNDFGIIVIAAVGPGRSGKSSLLNQLIRKASFGVGSSTSRVTKGIWIDSCLDYTKRIAKVFLDVEGFGDPKKDDAGASDTRLMFIVCQMCDVVIYNTLGVDDYDLTKKLEDFDLDIPKHPDEELRCQLRQGRVTCFRSMKAFFLKRPTNRHKLRHLDKITDGELDKEYLQSRQRLEQYIQMEAKPLCTQSGKQITAKVFVEAIRKIINAVVEDNLDGISESLTGLLKKQNDMIVKEAVQKYKQEITKHWPITTPAELHQERLQQSMKRELEEKLYDIEGLLSNLLYHFEQETRQIFLKVSERKAKAQLETLNSNIDSKYTNGSYFVIGGSVQFKADMKSLEKKYNQYVNLGPKANIVLEEYKKNQLSKIQIIRDRENAIKAANQRDEEMIERNRLVNQMNQDREEHNLMIRRQEEMQDQRNAEMDDLLSSMISQIAHQFL